jgi:hypothetical protein
VSSPVEMVPTADVSVISERIANRVFAFRGGSHNSVLLDREEFKHLLAESGRLAIEFNARKPLTLVKNRSVKSNDRKALTIFVFFALLVISSTARAEPATSSPSVSLSNALTAWAHVFSAVDWSLTAGIAVDRALDWASTEECIRRPYQQCHEAELPSALVHNRAGFAAFEIGAASLSAFSEYEGVRHGHPKVARLIALTVWSGMDVVVVHNFKLASK